MAKLRDEPMTVREVENRIKGIKNNDSTHGQVQLLIGLVEDIAVNGVDPEKERIRKTLTRLRFSPTCKSCFENIDMIRERHPYCVEDGS